MKKPILPIITGAVSAFFAGYFIFSNQPAGVSIYGLFLLAIISLITALGALTGLVIGNIIFAITRNREMTEDNINIISSVFTALFVAIAAYYYYW